jgi:hypothetical protein
MAVSQCPCCFTSLEVRDVTPCDVCGGWPESVTRFNPAAEYTEYRLPSGRTIVLCRACELEEFMVPGGWGYRLAPHEGLPLNALQRVRSVESPRIGRDQFCPTCNIRLAFASVVAASPTHAEPLSLPQRQVKMEEE